MRWVFFSQHHSFKEDSRPTIHDLIFNSNGWKITVWRIADILYWKALKQLKWLMNYDSNESTHKGNNIQTCQVQRNIYATSIKGKKAFLFDTVLFPASQPDTAVEISSSCVCLLFFVRRREQKQRKKQSEAERERKKLVHQSSNFLLPTMSSVSCVPSFVSLNESGQTSTVLLHMLTHWQTPSDNIFKNYLFILGKQHDIIYI